MKLTRAQRKARNSRKMRMARKTRMARRHRGGAGTVIINGVMDKKIPIVTSTTPGITITSTPDSVTINIDPSLGKLKSLKVVTLNNGVESKSDPLTFSTSPTWAARFDPNNYMYTLPVPTQYKSIVMSNFSGALKGWTAPVVGATPGTNPNMKITMTFV